MSDGITRDSETLSRVNDGLLLLQKQDGLRFGTDALLLAAFVKKHAKTSFGIEIGSGTGIVSLLLLKREKVGRICALEVQEEYAALSVRNAELNGLSERLSVVHADARSFRPETEADLLFANPPYMRADAGKKNESEAAFAARHENSGTLREICHAASSMLKYGGCLDLVYRPDRLTELLCAMREEGMEPKVLLFAAQTPRHAPSLVFCEGKKGAKEGVNVPRVLYLKQENGENSPDYTALLETGSLPAALRP